MPNQVLIPSPFKSWRTRLDAVDAGYRQELGVTDVWRRATIFLGGSSLSRQHYCNNFDGEPQLALAAYNAGPWRRQPS